MGWEEAALFSKLGSSQHFLFVNSGLVYLRGPYQPPFKEMKQPDLVRGEKEQGIHMMQVVNMHVAVIHLRLSSKVAFGMGLGVKAAER